MVIHHLKKIALGLAILGTLSTLRAGNAFSAVPSPMAKSGLYTLDRGAITRDFRVYLPKGYNPQKPAPLVVLFHGWGGDENEFLSSRVVRDEADRRGYILVAPRGLGSGAPDFRYNSWTFSGRSTGLDGDGVNPRVPGDTAATCDPSATANYAYRSCTDVAANTCSWTQCQDDDLGFFLALLDYLETRLSIDQRNVFACGGSNGGMFTWYLGQTPASAARLRAIAPLIGLPHRAYLAPPGRGGDLPVILITGTRDTTVPPGPWENPSYTASSDGDRYFYTGATAITRVWAAAMGCDTSAPAVPFHDGYPETDARTYCSSDPGWPRVLDCRADMGHTYQFNWAWPLILDFFDHHRAP